MDRDEIVMIAGASMGMFTGYALAADKLDELEHIYRSIDIPKKSELFWQVFAHDLLAATTESIVKAGDVLDIPFCFPVCVLSLCPVRYYLLHGPFNRLWPKYMHAGVNYPFLKIFPSVVEHRLAIDGGAMDNIPLYPILVRRFLRRVIERALRENGNDKPETEDRKDQAQTRAAARAVDLAHLLARHVTGERLDREGVEERLIRRTHNFGLFSLCRPKTVVRPLTEYRQGSLLVIFSCLCGCASF